MKDFREFINPDRLYRSTLNNGAPFTQNTHQSRTRSQPPNRYYNSTSSQESLRAPVVDQLGHNAANCRSRSQQGSPCNAPVSNKPCAMNKQTRPLTRGQALSKILGNYQKLAAGWQERAFQPRSACPVRFEQPKPVCPNPCEPPKVPSLTPCNIQSKSECGGTCDAPKKEAKSCPDPCAKQLSCPASCKPQGLVNPHDPERFKLNITCDKSKNKTCDPMEKPKSKEICSPCDFADKQNLPSPCGNRYLQPCPLLTRTTCDELKLVKDYRERLRKIEFMIDPEEKDSKTTLSGECVEDYLKGLDPVSKYALLGFFQEMSCLPEFERSQYAHTPYYSPAPSATMQHMEIFKDALKHQLYWQEKYMEAYRDYEPPEYRVRRVVIEWLKFVCMWLGLPTSVLFKTVSLMDFFLWRKPSIHGEYQLVALAALMIAKHFWNPRYCISSSHLLQSVGFSYTKEQLRATQEVLRKMIGEKYYVPTCYNFIDFYWLGLLDLPTRRRHWIRRAIQYLLEASLGEVEFLRYSPSLRCAAVILMLRRYLRRKYPELEMRHDWPLAMVDFTGHQRTDILDYVANLYAKLLWTINDIYLGSKPCKKKFVVLGSFVKYASPHYTSIALDDDLVHFRLENLNEHFTTKFDHSKEVF